MRLAYFSPLTPIKSEISHYSEELLPKLAKYARVDIFIDDYIPTNPAITDSFNIYHYAKYSDKASQYDLTLYHLGNSKDCRYLYPFIFNHPGITVLHDSSFFHLMASIGSEHRDLNGLHQELKNGYDDMGISVAYRFHNDIFGEFEKRNSSITSHIINASRAVVVQNHYDEDQIRINHSRKKVVQIPQLIGKSNLVSDRELDVLRLKWGFSAEDCILVSFGTIGHSERVPISLHIFARLIKDFPNLRYILAGECSKDYDVIQEIRNLNLEEFIFLTGFVDDTAYQDYLQIADICIHLRYPLTGESDAILSRCFAAGIPTLVSNYRQYAEYPNECCLKIGLGPNEEYDLFVSLYRLVKDRTLRRQYGDNIQKYVTENCSVDQIVSRYIVFLESILLEEHQMKTIASQKGKLADLRRVTEEINGLQMSKMQDVILNELLPLV